MSPEAIAATLAALGGWTAWKWLWAVSAFLVLALGFLLQDPRETPPRDAGSVASPADVFGGGSGRIAVRQIAGLLARRVICRLSPGQPVRRGQRMGIICFGSRAEVYLPGGAELAVVPGQRVKAGVTIIAHLADKENNNHAIRNPFSERAAGPALRTL